MADDKTPRQDGADVNFRAMRRTSRPLNPAEDVTNIFDMNGDPVPDETAPGPAHVQTATRKFGQVRMLAAPSDCPPALIEALVRKIPNIGRFCDRALLFQAEFDGGEGGLMVCFSDVEPQDVARVEGAVADALMASGHEDHALGILFLHSQAEALERIESVSLDLRRGT